MTDSLETSDISNSVVYGPKLPTSFFPLYAIHHGLEGVPGYAKYLQMKEANQLGYQGATGPASDAESVQRS